MTLRDYQQKTVEQAMAEFEAFGSKNIVIELPTGGGKSLIISELTRQLVSRGTVVIMVNITPLINQISEHLDELGIKHSVLKAGEEHRYDEEEKVHIVMSQTYYARQDKIDIDGDFIIIDERHREYATTRTMALINNMQPKCVFGLSATPYDQAGYALLGSDDVRCTSVVDLERDGYLSPIKYLIPKYVDLIDFESISKSGVDYSEAAIDSVFNTVENVDNAIDAMNMVGAKNKKTLVFCNSIAHCEAMNKSLRKNGYNSHAIHSKISNKECESILDTFKSTKAIFDANNDQQSICLVSVSKLNIGFDVKDIQLGVMLRPTKVRSLYIQSVGRCTRVHEGKEFAEFLDLAGVVKEHGFHTDFYRPMADKKEVIKEKARLKIQSFGELLKREPIEVSRKIVEFEIKRIEEKTKTIQTMELTELIAIYEQSWRPDQIIPIAFEINARKNKSKYKPETIDWILTAWNEAFELYPEKQVHWSKALKTRAKTLVRDNKRLTSLKYFVDFLVEHKDELLTYLHWEKI